jgi:putative glutamine amidotransferase
VAPELYGESADPDPRPGLRLDPARDATTIPLVRPALREGVPLLAICRGLEELNVAFGGTLCPSLHRTPGRMDHREDESRPRDVQYAPVHAVRLTPGGTLARLWGREEVRVNSLHDQGIARLGDGLEVEATAPDGLIEAVRVPGAPAFALGVQWHPEWFAVEDPFSLCVLRAFGEACRGRALDRRSPVPAPEPLRPRPAPPSPLGVTSDRLEGETP